MWVEDVVVVGAGNRARQQAGVQLGAEESGGKVRVSGGGGGGYI